MTPRVAPGNRPAELVSDWCLWLPLATEDNTATDNLADVGVAVLGTAAAVAIPNVGKFMIQGKTESYETELHNSQIAMLADSTTSALTPVTITTADGTIVQTTPQSGNASASYSAFPENEELATEWQIGGKLFSCLRLGGAATVVPAAVDMSQMMPDTSGRKKMERTQR